MEETGLAEEEIDRALLWKRARLDKSGKYDPRAELVVKKIVSSLLSQIMYIYRIGPKLCNFTEFVPTDVNLQNLSQLM